MRRLGIAFLAIALVLVPASLLGGLTLTCAAPPGTPVGHPPGPASCARSISPPAVVALSVGLALGASGAIVLARGGASLRVGRAERPLAWVGLALALAALVAFAALNARPASTCTVQMGSAGDAETCTVQPPSWVLPAYVGSILLLLAGIAAMLYRGGLAILARKP